MSNLDVINIDLTTVHTLDNIWVHSSGDYPFVLNSDGYLESTNKGVQNSFSYCVLFFKVAQRTGKLAINYICQGANNTQDYALFSQLDNALFEASTSSTQEQSIVKTQNQGSTEVKTLNYLEIPQGDHFITIKYIKKSSTSNSNLDSLQWKIDPTQSTVEFCTWPLIPKTSFKKPIIISNYDYSTYTTIDESRHLLIADLTELAVSKCYGQPYSLAIPNWDNCYYQQPSIKFFDHNCICQEEWDLLGNTPEEFKLAFWPGTYGPAATKMQQALSSISNSTLQSLNLYELINKWWPLFSTDGVTISKQPFFKLRVATNNGAFSYEVNFVFDDLEAQSTSTSVNSFSIFSQFLQYLYYSVSFSYSENDSNNVTDFFRYAAEFLQHGLNNDTERAIFKSFFTPKFLMC